MILGFNIKYYGNYNNPATIFTLLWTGIIVLYSFHLYGLYYIDELIFFYLIMGICFYNMGCLVSSKYSIKVRPAVIYDINEKLFELLALIAVIILLFGVFQNVNLLLHSSLSALSIRYGDSSTLNDSDLYVILRDFFAVPMVYVSICINFANLIEKKIRIKNILVMCCLVLFDFFALFEQACIYAFIIAVIYLVLTIFRNRSDNINIRRIKKYIRYGIILAIVALIIMINYRESSLVKSIYEYTTGSLVCFNEKYKQLVRNDASSIYGIRTYGLSSLLGLFRPINSVLQRIGVNWEMFENASKFYWPYLGIPISISPTTNDYNSFVTMFLYLYKDGGILGIFFGSFLYGVFCQFIYKKQRKLLSTYNLALYIYVVLGVFLTYSQFPFVNHKFAIALFIFIFIRRKQYDCVWNSNI